MKRTIIVILILILIILLLYFLLGKNGETKPDIKDAVAVVGNTTITKEMLNKELLLYQKINPDFRITEDTKAKVLNNLINKYVLIEEAKREKLDTSPEFINKIRNYWEETLIQILYKRAEKKIDVVVSEEELRDFYDIKKKKVEGFVGTYLTEEEAKRGLKNFPDKSAVKYFDINNSNLPLKLKLEIKNLKEGEISPILNIEGKFYIIKVTKIDEKDIPPFEKIRGMLKNELSQIKKQRKFDEWLNSLKKRTNVKIYYSNLR